ncbi:hypothetical protein [Neopusillimonas aromaticivorans]|uniref:hypothetical protein n=1 Tax=Neopusillimonas aromaticivorans TaxID=2979868 RepID=UPI002592ADBE|nr:hypothetical protein [Neopusillimonas aromaticivorans]WJJ94010.1 hypothetical protein N7E01_02185 [Neopusillimonas aromaticivorans]
MRLRDMLGFYLCDGLKAGCHAEKSACGIRLKQGEDQPRQEAAIEPVKELMAVRVGGRIEQREVVGKQFARRLDGTEVLIQKEPALKEGEVVFRYLGDDLPLILFVEPSPHPGGKSSGA